MNVSSASLTPGQTVPHKYVYNGMGCDGENMSPHLAWNNAPEETKSFAITVHDPDAPTDRGWWHWAVVNIPKEVHEVAEGSRSVFE